MFNLSVLLEYVFNNSFLSPALFVPQCWIFVCFCFVYFFKCVIIHPVLLHQSLYMACHFQISIYQPNSGKGTPVSDSPPSPPPDHSTIYSYHELPSKYWKKYQYAAKFVQLVRTKTPKVTVYTKHAKCMLMENAPNGDFEACFYDGRL